MKVKTGKLILAWIVLFLASSGAIEILKSFTGVHLEGSLFSRVAYVLIQQCTGMFIVLILLILWERKG